MEPLSALSLAGTIIQFVDFGSKLISQGYNLYKSTDGQLEGDKELERVASHLRDVMVRIESEIGIATSNRPFSANIDDTSLITSLSKLSVETVEIVQAILIKLDGFKIDSSTESSIDRGKQTMHHIIKRLWSGKELSQLQERLKTLKEEIDRVILAAILQKTNDHYLHLSTLFDRLDQQTQLIVTTLIESQQLIAEEHRKNIGTVVGRLMKQQKIPGVDEHFQIQDSTLAYHQDRFVSLSAITVGEKKLDPSPSAKKRAWELTSISILQSLKYATMSNRYESLSEPHPQTLEWAFHEFHDSDSNVVSWENLAQWLKTGEGIYWIGGKPGSGKSTLMRHLYDDARTYQYLQQWVRTGNTNDTPLGLASFFFWNSGSAEQRSLSGMLRSLLFQILTHQKKLIPIAFPEIWTAQYSDTLYNQKDSLSWDKPWSLGRLSKAFEDTLTQTVTPMKLCLLIDGLDEFDGEHEILAAFFSGSGSFKLNSNVKVCLSSRPWNIYRETFGHGPSLQMQNLNREDIKRYVVDRFTTNEPFQKLAKSNPRIIIELQEEIIIKAQGVFIWVFIVVRDILNAARNRDSVTELWQRVQALPRDIEPLYKHIMSQIEPFYLPWSSKLFQIVRARLELGSLPKPKRFAKENLRLTFLATDDGGGGCPSIAEVYLSLDENLCYESVEKMTNDQLNNNCQETEFHVVARSACLLEVCSMKGENNLPSNRFVQYLHRTARDFIEEPTRWKGVLAGTSGINFDPYFYLMKSHGLALHKLCSEKDIIIHHPPNKKILDAARRILIFSTYANDHSPSCSEQYQILDAMAANLTKHSISPSYWPKPFSHHAIPKPLQDQFMSVALFFNLHQYIQEKLRRLHFLAGDARGAKILATYMLHRIDSRHELRLHRPQHMSLEMVRVLIKFGADVNFKAVSKKTTWQHFLHVNLPSAIDPSADSGLTPKHWGLNPSWVPIMSLFLKARADIDVCVDVKSPQGKPQSISLDQFCDVHVRRYSADDAESILQDIRAARQRSQDAATNQRKNSQAQKILNFLSYFVGRPKNNS